jgi:TerC family integral membrane protein
MQRNAGIARRTLSFVFTSLALVATIHPSTAFPIISTSTRATKLQSSTSISSSFLPPTVSKSNSFSRPLLHSNSNSNSNSNSRKTRVSLNLNNNNENSLIGAGPTVIIEPNEPDDEIYASAISRTISWVIAAALFGLGCDLAFGQEVAEEFFAGYLVEQSLSIDNLFVFLLLFDYFKVPLAYQDRVLNYGIYGAIVMRAVMIGLGSVALHEFHGILLVFASILIYSSANVLIGGDDDEEEDMSENKIVMFSRNLFDASEKFDGDRFFTLVEGVKKATPLFICMVAVEISDVVFAVDSIPAVFGVTENPLVVFSSNMFAIMGLRSLYTILSKAAQDLEYLEPAVAVVLGFIGSKMVLEYFGILIPTELSLGVVLTFLSGGVGLSVYSKNQKELEGE